MTDPHSPAAVTLADLEFEYPRSDFRLRIERLTVARGNRVAFIGPSGSGKTTLLHLLAGITLPKHGTLQVEGTDVTQLSEPARRAFRLSRIGLVFQEFELLEHLSVLDNVLLPYRLSGHWRLDAEVRRRAEQRATDLDITRLLPRYPRQLSQGEKQRVALCRALVPEPPLILADEPTGNLDPTNKDRVLQMLLEYAAKHQATLVIVTHDHGILERFDPVIDFAQFHDVHPQPAGRDV